MHTHPHPTSRSRGLWGSRGRRFKSCQPDTELLQVRDLTDARASIKWSCCTSLLHTVSAFHSPAAGSCSATGSPSRSCQSLVTAGGRLSERCNMGRAPACACGPGGGLTRTLEVPCPPSISPSPAGIALFRRAALGTQERRGHPVVRGPTGCHHPPDSMPAAVPISGGHRPCPAGCTLTGLWMGSATRGLWGPWQVQAQAAFRRSPRTVVGRPAGTSPSRARRPPGDSSPWRASPCLLAGSPDEASTPGVLRLRWVASGSPTTTFPETARSLTVAHSQ